VGGFGSGRWGWHTPATLVEHCRRIDLTEMGADGTFRPGAAGTLEWRNRGGDASGSVSFTVETSGGLVLRLCYRLTPAAGPARDMDLPVRLVRLPAPRGGSRWAGVCPLSVNGTACARRVVVLYLPPGATYFGCRQCHRLAYASSREHDHRVDALRRDPGSLERLLRDPRRASVGLLGVALAALRREEAATDRAMKAIERRKRRRERRRKRPQTPNGPDHSTGGTTDDGGHTPR
jgi:hypothetical protein